MIVASHAIGQGIRKNTQKDPYVIFNYLLNHIILSRYDVIGSDKETGPQSIDEEPHDLLDRFNSDDDSVDSYTAMPRLLWHIKSDLDLSSGNYEDIKDDGNDHVSFTINCRHQSDDQL